MERSSYVTTFSPGCVHDRTGRRTSPRRRWGDCRAAGPGARAGRSPPQRPSASARRPSSGWSAAPASGDIAKNCTGTSSISALRRSSPDSRCWLASLSVSGTGTPQRVGRADGARRRQRVGDIAAVQRQIQQAQRVAANVADGAQQRPVPVPQPVGLLDVADRQPAAAPDRVEPAQVRCDASVATSSPLYIPDDSNRTT